MKQTKEPESRSNVSVAGEGPVTLPDFLHRVGQDQAEPNAAFDWLAFFKKFNVRPKDLLRTRKIALKPAKAARLASGLTIEKTLEIVDALETALSDFRPGEPPFPLLTPAHIHVEQAASGLKVELPTSDSDREINRQRELTRLFFLLVTGHELAGNRPASQLDTLAYQYPHTVNVLRQGWQDGYSSTRQLSGAFGWSLFRWENLPLSDEQIEAVWQRMAQKPRRDAVPQQLELPPAEPRSFNRGGFPGVLVIGSLLIALVLMVAFLVFSFANPPAPVQGKPTVAPTATVIPSPTAPTGLQTTRQADGVNVTRLNPAYLTSNEQKYASPDSLAPGQAVRLNSQRNLRVLNAEWSLGQNVYLTLQDGGWEVWDTASGTRISRRELPDADQYAWVSWSPDGENFAAEGLDGKLRLGTGGRVLRTFAVELYYSPDDNFSPVSWSPDSSTLMLKISGNAQFQFWTFKGTPQPILGPTDQSGIDVKADSGQANLNQVLWSWSGDSRYIAFYLSTELKQVVIYDTHNSLTKAASLSVNWQPEGSANRVLTDQFIENATKSYIFANFAWSPDGKYMALQRWTRGNSVEAGDSIYQRQVAIWEVPSNLLTGQGEIAAAPSRITTLSLDNPNSPTLLAWSRNDRLLVDSREVAKANNGPVVKGNSVQVYDLQTGGDFAWTKTFSFSMPEFPYDVKAWWSPDGQRILVSDDLGYLAIYELPAPRFATKTFNIKALSATVDNQVDMAVPSPDGKWLATYSKAGGPRLREARAGQVNPNFYYPVYNATISYKWSADSRYLALIYSWPDGNSYNLRTKTVVRVWRFENLDAQPAPYSEMVIPTTADFVPKVEWNARSNDPELFYEQDQNTVGILKIVPGATLPATPTGVTAASITQGATPAATTTNPSPTQTPPVRYTIITTIDASEPLTRTGTFTSAGGATARQAASPTPANPQAGQLDPRSNIPQFLSAPRAWASNWSFMVGPLDNTRDYGILKLITPELPEQATKIAFQPGTEIKPEKAVVTAAAVSPDDRMIALGFDNGLVQLYNTSNGKLFQAYNAHAAAITVLTFSPDSKSLATGSNDHTVKVWETTNWKNTAMLRGQTRPIAFIHWFANSKTLVASSADPNSAVFWRIN